MGSRGRGSGVSNPHLQQWVVTSLWPMVVTALLTVGAAHWDCAAGEVKPEFVQILTSNKSRGQQGPNSCAMGPVTASGTQLVTVTESGHN